MIKREIFRKDVWRACELNWSDQMDMQRLWSDLESRADATLFQSWPWISNWWKVWGEALGLCPVVIGIWKHDQLVAMAPFYTRDYSLMPGLRLKQLQMMGNVWRGANTVRSEYTRPLTDSKFERELQGILAEVLGKLKWDDMVLPDVEESGPATFWKDVDAYTVIRQEDTSWFVDTHDGDFEGYLSSLGKNTRLKLYNRRQWANDRYGMLHEWIDPDDFHAVARFLEQLNEFHVTRWGAPAFDLRATAFHLAMIQALPPAHVRLGVLRAGDQVVSVSYNLQYRNTLYNLQSGYIEDFDRKLSLGTLHMGYVIEWAFQMHEVARYDLLAGEGKRTAYKGHLSTHDTSFLTVQLVRHPLFRLGVKLYGRAPLTVRRWLQRTLRPYSG